MKTINYSELREHLKDNLDFVLQEDAELLVKRPGEKGNVIILSEASYSSYVETAYLLSTKANREHLKKSIEEAKDGKLTFIEPDDLWK
jgi:antitoxin YefM